MKPETEQLTGLFSLPGEGLLAQIEKNGVSTLYDVRGLQFLILDRKKKGEDASSLELALRQIRALENSPSAGAAFMRDLAETLHEPSERG